MSTPPRLEFDSGTAYDFFVSLFVLHRPEEFGLRPSWAAGVRSRLSEDTRKLMADVQHFVGAPGHWIHRLPQPKDSRAALDALERMDPVEVTRLLVLEPAGERTEPERVVRTVLDRGTWSASDVDAILAGKAEMGGPKTRRGEERGRLERWLDWVVRPAELGRAYVQGLREYRESFFREVERRLGPAVAAVLAHAEERARTLAPADLVEELTRGLRIASLLSTPRLLLVPSFWCAPRAMHGWLDAETQFVLFGARPSDTPLIPGDEVPDGLTTALGALAEPTRLNTLRLLGKESLTQAQIARRLRLRPSTISHHLNALRIAGLINVLETEGTERRYAARQPGIDEVCATLKGFLAP